MNEVGGVIIGKKSSINYKMVVRKLEHHIRYFGRFPVSQFNDSLGGVDLKCTQWVQFRSTQPKLYFPKIMEFSHL